jgi:hypothetical protein
MPKRPKISENDFLDIIEGFVRLGEVGKLGYLLEDVETSSRPIEEKARLLRKCEISINHEILKHLEKGYGWLASEFLIDRNILPLVSPIIVDLILEKILMTQFPPNDEQYILEKHREGLKSGQWIMMNTPDRLFAIAHTIISINSESHEDGFFKGYNKIQDQRFKEIVMYTAKSTERSSFLRIMRASYHRISDPDPRVPQLKEKPKPNGNDPH